MSPRIAAILGDGDMAAECARLVAEHDAFARPAIIHHDVDTPWSSQLEKVASELGIDLLSAGNVNDRAAVAHLKDMAPDIIFSVNNWDLIRAELLAIPADGVINFHNGPLPEYRGVNVPSWAIMNGERFHGVTWHFITADIDAGAIVATETFKLGPRETAISLTLRCIQAGLKLFPRLLDQYASGGLVSSPQKGEGRYYSGTTSPPNQGYLDFNWPFERLSAIVRGLTFRPFDNPFTYPKIRTERGTLLVSDVSSCGRRNEGEDWACGEIRRIDRKGLVVRARDRLVRLSGLMEEDLSQAALPDLTDRYGLVPGNVITGRAP